MIPGILGVGVALVTLVLLLRDKSVEQQQDGDGGENVIDASGYTLDELYKDTGAVHGIDWRLLKAIAIVESSERPNAENPTDPSVGLMQILCVPDGKGGCANNLNVIGWPPPSKDNLFEPDYNLFIAAQILAWNIDTYGFKRGIAVYNRWDSRNDPPDGPFGNEDYVNKVLGKYVEQGGRFTDGQNSL